jgi:hypothetical protein
VKVRFDYLGSRGYKPAGAVLRKKISHVPTASNQSWLRCWFRGGLVQSLPDALTCGLHGSRFGLLGAQGGYGFFESFRGILR